MASLVLVTVTIVAAAKQAVDAALFVLGLGAFVRVPEKLCLALAHVRPRAAL